MPRRKVVPVETSQWSEKSKRSLDYVFAPAFYEDKPFRCRACGAASVFTAEQQKREYEIKKAFTWQQHVLCPPCFMKRHELAAENDAFAKRWQHEKAGFKSDAAAIQRWVEVLESMPTYGARPDPGRIRMLMKLLENAA